MSRASIVPICTPRLRTRESLQQFLENEAGGENLICAEQGLAQCRNLRRDLLDVPTKRQRPDTRVDDQARSGE